MKAVIEKAIKNDFKLPLTTIGHTGTWHNTSDGFRPWINGLSIHELIFGTNLIECLVGEGEKREICTCNPLGSEECEPSDSCKERIQNELDNYKLRFVYYDEHTKNKCRHHQICYDKDADYHRAQMANMKDVEKLKEYVGGLI